MSRALILDFGGVVSKTVFETHSETELALGLSPGTLTWFGPFAPETDSLWASMQDGRISEREYYARRTREVSDLIGADWTEMSQFIRAARGADPAAIIRPEALDAIGTAKTQGHRLAILSNELDLFYGKDFRQKLSFLDSFDVVVDATYTKILKPDPRAYQQCCDALSLTPDDCVFVDDQPRNIAGAENAGMKTVQFNVARPGEGFRQAIALLNQHTGQFDAKL